MEIVSEPELRTPEEAGAYMKKLRTLLRFLEICDGDMEKGNLRCDANVSVRKIGTNVLNTRCEIKNLNSIRHVMHAIQHEAERQVQIWESGGSVDQETRLWDPDLQETRTLRSKEDAHDYRYFPDPDLLPVNLDPARIEKIRADMPELPDTLKSRFMADYGLTPYDSGLLTSEKTYADYYQDMLKSGADPKLAANWMTVELFAALNKSGKELEDSPITASAMGELITLITSGKISGKIAKQVFAVMLENTEKGVTQTPAQIVETQGLAQNSNEDELRTICAAALAANPDAVAKFKSGNERIFGSFVGYVMKETKGQANPELANKLLLELIAAQA
jgi:aspartyl-tRNA(Asn)/glutamyl-tRNA(Gln) amidotransferase subunit B